MLARTTGCLAILAIFVGLGPASLRGGVAQYDFNGTLDSATGQAPLGLLHAPSASTAALVFETIDIGGAAASVAHFGRGTYFQIQPGMPPNGGGSYVNQYTLILDLMMPDRAPSSGWASLYQTNESNANDGDWFVEPGNGIGISGNYGGSFPTLEWHRLALVLDLAAGTFTSYIDGIQVQQNSGEGIDGRFALYSINDGPLDGFFLFADESGDDAEGYVNSVQFRDVALTSDEIAALGGPSADGIPLPGVPQLAGDCDQDGERNITDIVCYIKTLFPGFYLLDRAAPAPACSSAAGQTAVLDVNGDSTIDLSDAISVARFIFLGGAPPVQGAGCFNVGRSLGCSANPACN